MTTGELLDEVRAYYLERFDAVVAEKCDLGGTVVTEAAYRDENGMPVGEGAFNLPARTDIFVIIDGRVTESINVDTSGMLSFEAVSFLWEGASVTVRPFQWNLCLVAASGAFNPETAATPFVHWFQGWFDAEEDGSPEERLGAVHFMSDPEVAPDGVKLDVDLGSAPIEALEELLDAAVKAGAKAITIGE